MGGAPRPSHSVHGTAAGLRPEGMLARRPVLRRHALCGNSRRGRRQPSSVIMSPSVWGSGYRIGAIGQKTWCDPTDGGTQANRPRGRPSPHTHSRNPLRHTQSQPVIFERAMRARMLSDS